jgi:hypothetical protein
VVETVAGRVAAALFLVTFVVACGNPTPTPTAEPSVAPTPTARALATPTSLVTVTHTVVSDPMVVPTPELPPSTPIAAISLWSAPQVPFAGEPVSLAIDAYLTDSAAVVQVASATVDFRDGSTGTTTGSCIAEATIDHDYRDGTYQPTVTAVTTCGSATTADRRDATMSIRVLPAAPSVSATWPTCSTFQLHMTGENVGAALGNDDARISLQNTSPVSCTLDGYPSVQLVASDGRLLPTTARSATGGSYMFPPVIPHRVALAPGGYASFLLGYAEGNEPNFVGCPTPAWVRVILPGTHEYGTAALAMGTCGGRVDVSPVVPGPNGFTY